MTFINLTSKQLDRISEIFGNLGLLFFASMSIPVFSGNNIDFSLFMAGLLAFSICTFESIVLIGGEVE